MPVSKGPDCVGDEMRRFKSGELHSGKSKKPVTNPQQAKAIALSVCGKSKYAEMIEGLGFNEESAQAFAEMYDFISAKDAEGAAGDGPTGDIQSTPGKQKGNSGRQKQAPQGSVATFPTLPKQAPGSEDFSDGPMIRAKGKSCPPGTKSVGGGFCRNPKPGKRQYFEIEKGKSCPPGSKTAGKGRCRVDFAEIPTQGAENAKKAIESTPCSARKKKDPNAPKKEVATPTKPTQPTQPQQAPTPAQQMLRDTAKKRAEQCAKQQGN